MNQNSILIGFIIVLLVIIVESAKSEPNIRSNCRKPRDGQQICSCGKNKILYDRLKGYTCYRGEVVRVNSLQK